MTTICFDRILDTVLKQFVRNNAEFFNKADFEIDE